MAVKVNSYDVVTNQIIKSLEAIASGDSKTPSWVKPWASIGAVRNAFTNRPYNGVNAFILPLVMGANGWDDPRFATYKQIANAGGQVKKGSKGVSVVLWKFLEDKKNPGKVIPLLRTFTVFNVKAQSEGVELKTNEAPNKDERNEKLEAIFSATGAELRHGGDRACFNYVNDVINMPVFEAFQTSDDYYATLAHETIHWTGHEDRLNRAIKNPFGSETYAFEELVAELGSAFFCQDHGVDGKFQDNHLAYIAGWIKGLKENNKAIFRAASLAKSAVKMVNGETTKETEEETATV